MNEYEFTVQQEGLIFIEADSEEEAEKKLNEGVITSSPGPIPSALKARTNASVPLLQPTAC